MSEDNEEAIDFPLEKRFKYATKDGGQDEASFIQLLPPTTRHSRECAALKQAFFRAVASGGGNDSVEVEVDKEKQKPSAVGVITVIAMSVDVDLGATLDTAKKLFSNGVAQVEGEVKLTSKLIELMAQDEFERMLGEYLVNFILASAVAQSQKKNS